MPYRSKAQAPPSLKSLSLAQANSWARLFDKFKAGGMDSGDAAARAWVVFKRTHKRAGGRWVKKQADKTEAHQLEFLELAEVQNPSRLSPDRHAARPTLGNRLFHATRQLDEDETIWGVYTDHFLVDTGDGFDLVPYRGTGQSLKLTESRTHISDDDAHALILELAEHEHSRVDLVEIGKRNSARDEERISQVVQLGMDLLGDDAVDSIVNKRRGKKKPKRKTRPADDNTAENQTVSETGTKARSATKRYKSESEAGGGGIHPQPTKLDPDVMTVERAAREATARLLGNLDPETMTEDRQKLIQDSLYALANELDLIATTHVVMDRKATLEVLERAIEAVPEMKGPLTSYATVLRESDKPWLPVTDQRAVELAVIADGIRAHLTDDHYQTEGTTSYQDLLDLYASDLSEACAAGKKKRKHGVPEHVQEARRKAREMMKKLKGKP